MFLIANIIDTLLSFGGFYHIIYTTLFRFAQRFSVFFQIFPLQTNTSSNQNGKIFLFKKI